MYRNNEDCRPIAAVELLSYDECIKFISHLNRGIMRECIRNIFSNIFSVDPLGLISRAYLECTEYRFSFSRLGIEVGRSVSGESFGDQTLVEGSVCPVSRLLYYGASDQCPLRSHNVGRCQKGRCLSFDTLFTVCHIGIITKRLRRLHNAIKRAVQWQTRCSRIEDNYFILKKYIQSEIIHRY